MQEAEASLVLTVPEATRLLGIFRTHAYGLVSRVAPWTTAHESDRQRPRDKRAKAPTTSRILSGPGDLPAQGPSS